jgi:cytochrome b involved in lipid metabolism
VITTISLQELAQHKTANDVYDVNDLTAFAGNHPGGSEVIIGIAVKGGLHVFESFHTQSTLQKLQENSFLEHRASDLLQNRLDN